MGCSATKNKIDAYEPGTQTYTQKEKEANSVFIQREEANSNHKATEDDEEEANDSDFYVTYEEAKAFIQQELGLDTSRVEKFLKTVETNEEGKYSSLELVVLNDRIKSIKGTLEPRFRFHDTTNSGYVTPKDALTILTEEIDGLPPDQVKSMVQRFDSDGNGQIDFEELVEFYANIKARRERMEQVFDELDEDHSGTLDAEELVETLINECAIEEFQARSLIEDFDSDKNGTIDKKEFLYLWSKLFG